MKYHRGVIFTDETRVGKLAIGIFTLLISASVKFQLASATNNNPKTKNMDGNDTAIVSVEDNYELMERNKSWPSYLLGTMCCSSCIRSFDFEPRGNTTSIVEGTAFDVIVVEGVGGNLFQNSDFLVSFKGKHVTAGNNSYKIVLEVGQGNDEGTKAWFPIIRQSQQVDEDHYKNDDDNDSFDEERFWGCCHPSAGSVKPNMLSNFSDGGIESIGDPSSALRAFLKHGRNPVRYLLLGEDKVIGVAHASIYLFRYSDSIVVCDIDGTITKSNALGVIGTILTQQFGKVCHVGICQLLSRLSSSSRVIYVTSRPISLANQTRKLLNGLTQENVTLPNGPLLGFGGNLPRVLMMEIINKNTNRFKAGKLWQHVVQPFRQAANNDVFYPIFIAGFGNNFMDMQSYHAVGMALNRIFKINARSEIVTFDNPNVTSQSYDGDLDFPTRQWFKDRIGTQFDGYTDPQLISQLCPN